MPRFKSAQRCVIKYLCLPLLINVCILVAIITFYLVPNNETFSCMLNVTFIKVNGKISIAVVIFPSVFVALRGHDTPVCLA